MKVLRTIFIISFLLGSIHFLQAENSSLKNESYDNAYQQIKTLLENKNEHGFEEAIFSIENAYYTNQLLKEAFTKEIDFHTNRILQLANTNKYRLYSDSTMLSDNKTLSPPKAEVDRELCLLNWAIFTYLCDTTYWKNRDVYEGQLPMQYSTRDPFGTENWENTFVTTLLDSTKRTGNCFALAALFKIFADRLNTEAYLVTAPHHIYIQHKGFDGNYYNIELATKSFPGNGSIKTVTYTTHEAITNGIAMRRLNDKESIALCLVQLAKGYERMSLSGVYPERSRRGRGVWGEVLQYAETTLQYDSLNFSAMLLKQEILEDQLFSYMENNQISSIDELQNREEILYTYSELKNTMLKLQHVGYKEMPSNMQEIILADIQHENTNQTINKNEYSNSPFEKLNASTHYYSLSNGKYPEIHVQNDTENKYTIGKICINTNNENQMTFISEPDKIKTEFDPISFALSIDPLDSKFPSVSPYSAMGNDPVNRIDPDGMQTENVIVMKYIDYLRVFHPEIDNSDIISKMKIYEGNISTDLADELQIELDQLVTQDVASGNYQSSGRLQMKEFRKQRKELSPFDWGISNIENSPVTYTRKDKYSDSESGEKFWHLDRIKEIGVTADFYSNLHVATIFLSETIDRLAELEQSENEKPTQREKRVLYRRLDRICNRIEKSNPDHSKEMLEEMENKKLLLDSY